MELTTPGPDSSHLRCRQLEAGSPVWPLMDTALSASHLCGLPELCTRGHKHTQVTRKWAGREMPSTWQLQSVPTHRKMRSLRSDTERCSSTSEVTFRMEPQVRLITLTPPGESKAFLNQKENFSSDSQSNVNTVILERRGEGACVCTSSSGEFKHPPVSA